MTLTLHVVTPLPYLTVMLRLTGRVVEFVNTVVNVGPIPVDGEPPTAVQATWSGGVGVGVRTGVGVGVRGGVGVGRGGVMVGVGVGVRVGSAMSERGVGVGAMTALTVIGLPDATVCSAG